LKTICLKTIFFYLYCLLSGTFCDAQDTVHFKSNKNVLENIKSHKGYFRILYDNDLFNDTDYYYTQGASFECAAPIFKKSPLNFLLLKFPKSTDYQNGIIAKQISYTPTSILSDSILYKDRPYSACLYVGHYSYSISRNRKHSLRSELQAGVIGPAALGGETQTLVHLMIGNTVPKGWGYQLNNDLYLEYVLSYQGIYLNLPFFQLLGTLDAQVGTVFDQVGIGSKINVGIFQKEMFLQNYKKFQLYFSFWGKATAVGFNATLQGSIFNEKNDYQLSNSAVNNFLWSRGVSIYLTVKRINLGFSRTWISPEFNQGLYHGWGSLDLKVFF
jgi:lipid A 3-O-deacylase